MVLRRPCRQLRRSTEIEDEFSKAMLTRRQCPDTDKPIIRFVGKGGEPRNGATAFITCQEKSFASPAESRRNARQQLSVMSMGAR